MSNFTQRVGVIEVGSRAVRLLVSDVGPEGLRTVLSRSEEVRLMSAVNGPPEQLEIALNSANRAVAELEDLAKRHGADKSVVFGTEALRRLRDAGRIRPDFALARVRALSAEEEALCSATAALSAAPEKDLPSGPFLVVDQGGGSVEVIVGRSKPSLQMLESESLDLGGDELLRRFADCDSSIDRLRLELRQEIVFRCVSAKPVAAFAQGSVATKCAWLSNPSRGRRYDPKLAQGRRLSVTGLDAMVNLFVASPKLQFDRMRAIFDPASPKSDDIERVVTGAIVLAELMRSFSIDEFRVSAHGTRHGVALVLGSENSNLYGA